MVTPLLGRRSGLVQTRAFFFPFNCRVFFFSFLHFSFLYNWAIMRLDIIYRYGSTTTLTLFQIAAFLCSKLST